MVSLLSSPAVPSVGDGADAASRPPRSLAWTSLGGGLVAATITLGACLSSGVFGWFLSDSGSHGAPRDGLRVGALGWLLAHRSGVMVEGVAITATPLLLTLLVAFTLWKVARRVGEAVSGHGPDAARIADGERDWTVPMATLGVTGGYAAVLIATHRLVGADAGASPIRLGLSVLAAAVLLIGPAIAIGSGRAAVWAAALPTALTAGFLATRAVVRGFLVLALAVFVLALLADLGTAVNVVSQLQLNTGGVVAFVLLAVLLLPNAALFAGAYLLGPGFAVGAGTAVTTGAVTVGPLPLFPLFAAVPSAGATPAWTPWLVVLPPIIAAVAVARTQHRHPTLRWDEGVVRGLGAGVVAGIAIGLLTALAGGAIGPGRMQVVAPFAGQVLAYAVTAFGVGGLIGAVAMTWWQRRTLGQFERAGESAGEPDSEDV